MSNRPLGECPTCHRPLDDEVREAMGLRTGAVLNALCPGRNGPCDIDHVLHNGRRSPERIYFLEYKRGEPEISGGQKYLLDALRGDWTESNGRLLSIRYAVLPNHPENPAAELLQPIVDWLWPP